MSTYLESGDAREERIGILKFYTQFLRRLNED